MRNILDVYKYLDKNGLKRLIDKIKKHDYHWTGTHAEYEAVKDTIPAYAILHFTDDYDENVQVGIYSTEETKTGELWIDGKPIYRKVITGLSFGSKVDTWTDTGATMSNVGTSISIIALRTSDNSVYHFDFVVAGDNKIMYQQNQADYNTLDMIIIEYTKNTD